MKVTIKSGTKPNDREIIAGGDPANPSWDDYLAEFTDDWQPRLLAIKEAIIDRGLVGTMACDFCNDHYFEFSDGVCASFTWQAWGDLMQAIVNKNEGYMTYYM